MQVNPRTPVIAGAGQVTRRPGSDGETSATLIGRLRGSRRAGALVRVADLATIAGLLEHDHIGTTVRIAGPGSLELSGD